ncbi:MAG: LIC_13387 family protein [Pyrinomonadaceae bacterium]
MLKRYRFWLWTAVVFLFLTALIHSLSLFIQPTPQNETERQLIGLLVNYKQDFGAGFNRSMKDLFTALSSCFSLICLLGGLTLAFLARKKADVSVLRGVVGIHAVIFGVCFVMMLVFTFLPPIVLTGVVFLCLLISYFLMPKHEISMA